MTSQPHLPEAISSKRKSKIEGSISIAYLLVLGLLLKSSSWFFGDAIDEKFGEQSGAFALYVVLPLSFVFAAFIVIAGSYFVISLAYGRDVAEEIIFRWRKKK